MPELRALATRIALMHLEVTDAELLALMRDLASRGYERDGKTVIAPEECGKVTERLISECAAAGCPLDLRLQINCYQDYLQWESDHTACSWEDLVSSRVHNAAHHFIHEPNTMPREDRHRLRRNIYRAIIQETDDPQERLRLYKERTGCERAEYFHRQREVRSGEFDDFDAEAA
jgi:hypothetical protein